MEQNELKDDKKPKTESGGGLPSLPKELLAGIATRLGSRVDIIRSRAVCKKWRSSFSIFPPPKTTKYKYKSCRPKPNLLSPFLPLKICKGVNLPFFDGKGLGFHLVATGIFLIHPLDDYSKGWIINAEETEPGKLRLMYPLGRAHVKLPHSFPKSLNLSEFRVSEICRAYTFRSNLHGHDYVDPLNRGCAGFLVSKVVLFPNPADVSPNIDDCMAMVLFGQGNLLAVTLKDQAWDYVRVSLTHPFDDIVSFKGMLCAVDRVGKLYAIDHKMLKVSKVVVETVIDNVGDGNHDMRKRLLESSGELYLVVRVGGLRGTARFRIFKLNETLRSWDEIDGLGDRVLFVSFDCCFLVPTPGIEGCETNCIVFTQNCFPSYGSGFYYDVDLFKRTSENLRIGVFRLGNGDNFGPISSFAGISSLVWPPPTWFWPETCSLKGVVNDNKKLKAGLGRHHRNSIGEAWAECMPNPSAKTDPKSVNAALEVESKFQATYPRTANGVKFQGASVKLESVAILEKVWEKYGDIVEGSAVRSSDMKSSALDSLAKVIALLQDNSAKTLTGRHADYMMSILSDLQYMRYNVKWLAPFVEKAYTLQKSKPLAAAAVKVEEEEKKFLAEVAVMEESQELDAESKLLSASESTLNPEQIDMDQCLGEGLF